MLSRRVLLLLALLGTVLGLIRKSQPMVRRLMVLDPALAKAVRQGDLSAIDSLVRQGANVNLRIPSREPFETRATPLMVACYQGDLKELQFLIAAGAKLDLANDQGRTPLMLAAQQAKPEVVRPLIRAGARVSAEDRWGSTALSECASAYSSIDGNDRIDTARQLIEAGASPSEIEEALRRAETMPNPQLARALRAAGGKGLADELRDQPGGKLFLAVRTSDMATLKQLVTSGEDFGVRDRDGRTSLMDAAQLRDPAILRFLLAHAPGLTPSLLDQQDNRVDTALIVATQRGNQDSVLALIAAGADVNRVN